MHVPSSSIERFFARGLCGPMGISSVVERDFHLMTVFGLIPYLCASALIDSDDVCIAARVAGVVVAEPCIRGPGVVFR